MTKAGTMAIDQYGVTYHDLGEKPREALLKHFGVKSCEKMYVDRDGKPVHAGYVIAGRWLMVYKVEGWGEK